MRNYLDMFEQSVDEEDEWIIYTPKGTTNGEVILKLFNSARIKAQNDTVVTLEILIVMYLMDSLETGGMHNTKEGV